MAIDFTFLIKRKYITVLISIECVDYKNVKIIHLFFCLFKMYEEVKVVIIFTILYYYKLLYCIGTANGLGVMNNILKSKPG